MAHSYDDPEVLDRVRQCLKKQRHKTEARGWQVAIKMWKRHGALLWCFECRHCGGYHLGNTKNPYYQWLLREASATW
jgi:hypothetical protein